MSVRASANAASDGWSYRRSGRQDVAASHVYAAFGGVLASAIPFPELTPIVSDEADWVLRVGSPDAAPMAETVLGHRQIGTERYCLSRTASGLRLHYSHAGQFDVSHDGRQITWHPGDNAQPELARWMVLGPVLALALEESGHVCLHGSAVALGDEAVAFIAPKHHGKSTIAVALTAAGAALISDDTLAISTRPSPAVRPGPGTVRLWDDAARELRIDTLCVRITKGVKTTATGFARAAIRSDATRLAAVYVMAPRSPDDERRLTDRSRLTTTAAMIAMARHAKLPDPLVGFERAGRRLRGVADIASAVPVYTLHLARGFEHLPTAVDRLLDWHRAGPGRAGDPCE